MNRSRLIMSGVWMAGLLIVVTLAAQLVLALRERSTAHRRLTAASAAFEAQQRTMWGTPIAIAAWNLPQGVPLEFAAPAPGGEPPAHPFIVPVPPQVDGWILEMRAPVTDEERSRWIPVEFDGVTYYLVPL